MKKITKEYIVVDKKEGVILSEHDTSQEAWEILQNFWFHSDIPRSEAYERFAKGKAKNMLKYIKKKW